MKIIKHLTVLTACMVLNCMLFAQVVTKTTASPVSGSVCPSIGSLYSVSVPTGFTTCTINWSAVNGAVTMDQSDQRKASVVWLDTPGAKGKVTATFSGCGNGNDGKTAQAVAQVFFRFLA